MKNTTQHQPALNSLRRLSRQTVKGLLVLMAFVLSTAANAQADGKTLFKQNCGVCHTTTDQKMVGPGLQGINEKRKEDWLIKWIKDSQALINSGDAEAKAVFDENNKQVMNPFTHLSDADIKSILAYIKEPSAGEPVATVAVNTAPVVIKRTLEISFAAKVAGVVVLCLIIILGVYVWNINRLVTSMGYESVKIRFFDYSIEDLLSRYRILVAIVCFILILLGVKSCYDAM